VISAMRHFAPFLIYSSAFVLAAIAGSINALGLLGAERRGVSHITGALTDAGVHAARSGDGSPLKGFLIVLAFLFGSMLSGLIVGDATLRLGRRYGVGLVLEGLLLIAAYVVARGDLSHATSYLTAIACGMQNALASNFSGAVLRTTHMTGVVTDLGILLGQALRGLPVDTWRLWLFLSLLGGFFTGALAGATLHGWLGPEALLLPAIGVIVGGSGYWIWAHRRHLSSS
jgi:uncharacterized membrane protein YoaK (UPF0700 family)